MRAYIHAPEAEKEGASRRENLYEILRTSTVLCTSLFSEREACRERERERERGVLEVIILSQNHEINSYVSCVGELKIVRKREGNDDKY
jgi:hypothetical protein